MSHLSTLWNSLKVRRATAILVTLGGLFAALPGIAQAASPAWKVLAVTGPTNLPPRQSETQRITVEAAGGSYTLTKLVAEGEGTPVTRSGVFELTEGSDIATIVFAEPPFEVGQLVTGAGIATGTTVIAVTATTVELSAPATETSGFSFLTALSKELSSVSSASGTFSVGDELSGEDIAAGTKITAVGAGGTTLTLSQFVTGASAEPVALKGFAVSSDLTVDASPIVVQAAVESLGFPAGSLSVNGGPGGTAETPYFVTFGGAPLAETNVDQLSVNGTNLEGAHADAHVDTTVPGGPGTGVIVVSPINVGGAATGGLITVHLGPLPEGIVTSGSAGGEEWSCPGGAGEETVTCTSLVSVSALQPTKNAIQIPVEVNRATTATTTVPVTIEGGGAAPASYPLEVPVSAKPAEFGVQAFWAGAFDTNGNPETQAGAHPFSAQTFFELNTVRSKSGDIVPAGDSKSVSVDLPPGFLGNPLVTSRCPQSQLTNPATFPNSSPLCGDEMIVGEFHPVLTLFGTAPAFEAPIYNDVPAAGTAAEFTTKLANPLQSLVGSLRSAGDGGVTIVAPNNANVNKIFGGYAVLIGEPAAANGAAFLDNPTDCAQQREESAENRGPGTVIRVSSWQLPGVENQRSDALPLLSGCQALTQAWLGQGEHPTKPSFTFDPTTAVGSSPAGATATLTIPQSGLTDPTALATADLKKAIVTLPQGVVVNPSSANGLEACSESQIGLLGSHFASPAPIRFSEEPPTCPDGSKLGTFEVSTPLLEEPIGGTIYLAAQEENPFHSLLAIYLAVESPRFGLNVKLAGEVQPNPTNGQLTATFDNNPQVPIKSLTLHFRGGGPRSEFATPEVCGPYRTGGSLTPWSAEQGEAAQIEEAGFAVSDSCASSDAARPFSPGFEAGTTGTQAGSYNPLVIKVTRKDGEQELKRLNFTLPKGLTGKLAGIPYCPDSAISDAEGKSGKAEQASPSCPATSQIGTVDTAAGVGSEPIHVAGKVYLAGPYEGAPLSSVVMTPAVAGPFDLGDVVIRAPLFVDPESAQITAKSDPIPTILRGIPLKVRSVAINLDRSDFTLNPTSCNVMMATASIGGSSGATATPSNRFQVGGCNKLKFKPKLKISLNGPTKRAGLPALKAVVTYPKKGAYSNIARAQVNLPHSEFLEQNNLNKTCTKPVLLEGKCPKSTIYGKAKAWTPLLDKPLEGPVYLVGGYGYKLPALVAELNGQIRVVLKGKVDSGPNKGIRNTFEAVPDAPVSRFVLEMKGGKKYGLLINSENLCKKPQRGNVRFTAQNGLVDQFKPLIANDCGKGKKGKNGGKGKKPKHH
jgi:hypothetical protein